MIPSCYYSEHVPSASPNYHDQPRIIAKRSGQAPPVGAQLPISRVTGQLLCGVGRYSDRYE